MNSPWSFWSKGRFFLEPKCLEQVLGRLFLARYWKPEISHVFTMVPEKHQLHGGVLHMFTQSLIILISGDQRANLVTSDPSGATPSGDISNSCWALNGALGGAWILMDLNLPKGSFLFFATSNYQIDKSNPSIFLTVNDSSTFWGVSICKVGAT